MTDLVAKLRLDASAGNAPAVIGGVRREVESLAPAGQRAAGGLRQADTASAGLERSARGAGGAATALGAALGAIGLREFAGKIKDAAFEAQGLTTGLNAVTGGALGAADAQAFVRAESERMGLVIKDQTQSYLQLAAATNGTSLAGEKTKNIWQGLVVAGTALNTSDEKRARALEAVAQMASKGVVSQEELRQQLSEALPGSLQVAQRALGKYGLEFDKLVASGNLLASDFLPKFAAQLQKEFGPKIDQALTQPLGRARIELAETANIGDRLKATTGTAFLEGLTSGVAALNDELGSADVQEAAKAFGHDLGQGLSAAAQGAAFLVDHLKEVETVATAVVGVSVAKWLVTTAAEARGAAVAYLAKGKAAQGAAAQAISAAEGEAGASIGLRAAVEAAARAEVQGAIAARDLALANEQAAAATLAQARAEAASLASTLTLAEKRTVVAAAERELAVAQTATVAASARAEAAAVTLTKATSLGGAAAQGAKTLFGGLMTLLGGPWGIALAAAAGGVFLLQKHLQDLEAERAEFEAHTQSIATALADTDKYARAAAGGIDALGIGSKNATGPTDGLAKSMGRFADETYRAAAAQKELAINSLMKASAEVGADITRLESKVKKTSNQGAALTGAMLGDAAFTGLGQDLIKEGAKVPANNPDQKLLDQRRKEDAALQRRILDIANRPITDFAPPKTTTSGGGGGSTKADKAELKALDRAQDLDAARLAQEAYTKALVAGGSALDEWNIKEAGRQAVERLALADRPKLTDAEQKLVAQIRARAEETERLKIANERIERAIGLKKTADEETKALQARSIAAGQGEAALEALEVKEAGLQARQQLGIDSLDQLTGATLEHAKAAIEAAEAKEKQSIATAKAERVATAIRDLDQRTASEKAYAVAVAGGTEALVAYQRQEFERQEIERAGKTLTDDQVAAIKAKADALFAAKAAADSADLNQRFAEELRLSQMTNQERAIEERYLQRKSLLLAEHVDWTKEEVEARARALALADEAAAQDAQAKGDLKEGLKQAFIESGHLGFEDVGDFVERRLREAVYNALLAKPIDILVNAVVGSFSSSNILGLGGAGGQLGAGSTGVAGLASLFTSSGALKGLTTGATDLASTVLGKLGIGNAGGLAAGFGSAVGGAGTGMLVSSLAGLLGLKQTSGNKIGGAIGGAIGSFIPIPGGSIIGSIAGNLIGGLVGGKPSNHAAVVSLDSKGQVISTDGAKRTDETTAAANQVAQAVAQIQAALVAGGATLSATVSKIDIGTRDSTHLNFSNGQSLDTAVGDVAAAIEGATKTILANAKWQTEAQTAYAQKLLAAGATIDEVVASMQVATNFAGSIDDAIAQLTDPAAYAKKQALDAIDANYQALKKQAQELIAAGLATEDVLGKIDQLKDLQVDEALKRLGDAADNAANALDPTAFKGSIQDQIAQLLDPVGFERAKALSDIEANYQALKAQAQSLVDAGKLSADVLTQLDQLKGLQVADSIKKLGDAASDAAKALSDTAAAQKAADDFASGIDDAILQLTDPVQAKVNAIVRDYEAKVAQAQTMIAAGQLGVGVLDQLAALRDLQIEDVMKGLAESTAQVVDVFAEARPRLQQWLDSLSVGANSPLNAGGQRDAALASYERLYAQALGGDSDALSQITGAADQLLSADKTATSSASDRLSLFNRVQSDIQRLTTLSGGAVGSNASLVEARKATTLLTSLTEALDPKLVALRPPAPVEVKLSPWLQTFHKDNTAAQTKVLQELLQKVVDKSDELRTATADGLSRVGMQLDNGLGALGGSLAASQRAMADALQALADQVNAATSQQALTSAYLRQGVSR